MVAEGEAAINPIDEPRLSGINAFNTAISLRGYFYLGLAMAVSVPLVRTKLLSYAIGAALGGAAGAYLGSYTNSINANQFKFSFSIFVLAMIILGGLGSVWGSVIGAVLLTYIDRKFIPGTLDNIDIQGKLGLDFSFADLSFGIFGFLLVLMMVLRPQGLFPERRRKLELTEGLGSDESVYEARA